MQVDLGTAITIATQVGTTTAILIVLKMIVSRLDRQNGKITKNEDLLHTHIADRMVHK